MKLGFPSPEFDEAVADVCHGTVSDEQARALNELLRTDPAARDEYILRAELHSRLASDPDLFVSAVPNVDSAATTGSGGRGEHPENVVSFRRSKPVFRWAVALAAGLAIVAGGSAFNRDRQKTLKSGASYVPSTLKEAKEDFIAQRRGARKKSGRMTFSGTRFRVPPPA